MSFPAYPNYRDTGVEWLGIMPSHWAISRIKFDSSVKARVGWHGLKSDEFTDEGPYLVTGSDFKGKTIDWGNCYHCTEDRYDQDRNIQLSEGDLLITKDGTIGKLMLVTDLPGPATLNSGIFVVRPEKASYKTAFYYWMLQSSVFYDFIAVRQTGSTIIHLYQETFGNLPYGLPPLQEQTRIARFLDHETAKIDALIREQERLIELLKEKRQAVISHAVTKGLDPSVPMKDSGVEWLGEVPAHWDVTRLKFATNLIVDCPHETPNYDPEGEFLVIRTADLHEGVLNPSGMYRLQKVDFIHRTRRAALLKSDIVYGREGERWGHAALVPEDNVYCLGQRMMQFRSNADLDSQFLMYQLNSDFVYRQGDLDTVGATAPHVNVSTIKNFSLTCPPKQEQHQIGKYLYEVLARYDELIDEAIGFISILNERRSALISAAVTGKIDVRNWQPPADESAFDEEVRHAGMEATA